MCWDLCTDQEQPHYFIITSNIAPCICSEALLLFSVRFWIFARCCNIWDYKKYPIFFPNKSERNLLFRQHPACHGTFPEWLHSQKLINYKCMLFVRIWGVFLPWLPALFVFSFFSQWSIGDGDSSVVRAPDSWLKGPRVQIPVGAAGEFSSPGSTFCADSNFGIRSTPVLPQ